MFRRKAIVILENRRSDRGSATKKTFVFFIILCFMLGCTGIRAARSPKRYLQLKDQKSSDIVQLSFPNEKVCRDLSSRIISTTAGHAIHNNAVCGESSISSCLPFKIKAKDRMTTAVLEIEVSTLDRCKKIESDFANMDILVSCRNEMENRESEEMLGRYLQLRHPVSSHVLLQRDYPNVVVCVDDLLKISRQIKKGTPQLVEHLSCKSVSCSPCLPFTAVYRNKLQNTTINTHYMSIEFCKGIAENTGNDPSVETVVPCRMK